MLRIGTRSSPLALWQAEKVQSELKNFFPKTKICPIKSGGDINLKTPLYEMGVTGIFTKDLDIALLHNHIDIAVHSLKDMPTVPPKGIITAAVLPRDYPKDIMVRSSAARDKPISELKIATSSLRRKAFWQSQFPETEFCDIRGNVQTRLSKLEEGLADATFFSQAGIARMNLVEDYEILEDALMISAPGQGVIGISCRKEDFKNKFKVAFSHINCELTRACTEAERNLLHALEGGCTAPIGAYCEASSEENVSFTFKARLASLDGKKLVNVEETILCTLESLPKYGIELAEKIKSLGGKEIMESLQSH